MTEENKLTKNIRLFFIGLEKEILKIINERWDEISFSFQLDEFLTPIHENHQLYFQLLYNSLLKIYNLGGEYVAKKADVVDLFGFDPETLEELKK